MPVSVLPAEDLKQAHVKRLDDIDARLPGLMVTQNDGAGRVASIRGVGWETAQNLSTQPPPRQLIASARWRF